MLSPVPVITKSTNWQEALSQSVNNGAHLLQLLGLDAQQVGLSEQAAKDFPIKTTHSYVARMAPGDPNDPLLRQVLASGLEEQQVPGYTADPVGEVAHSNVQSGMLQKYDGRVLLLVTSACAVHCRYCFRRHFPYSDNRNSRADWALAVDAIAQDASIREVIFSGGDPLVASDGQLKALVDAVARLPHVRRLRFHSRLPIVLPERVNDPLIDAITHPDARTAMVVHANHPQEINTEVSRALRHLVERDVSVLNQSVLLAGINDSVETLAALSETLYDAGTLPYYLHLLDKVSGAAHFDVPLESARRLHQALHARLPGYLVPRLVKEEAGASGKTLLA